MSKINGIITARSGGVLSLSKLEEVFFTNGEAKPTIMLSSKQARKLMKKAPKGRYICSFERMLEPIKNIDL